MSPAGFPARTMVEGHGVHRVARNIKSLLVGKRFRASSPNGRFKTGAEAIDGQTLYRVEAVGKNLFTFWGDPSSPVVVHVHFGMSGAWSIHTKNPPATRETTRLLLENGDGLTSQLSAMTCDHAGTELYQNKRLKLGQDPLRDDADPEVLWDKVSKSKKSIGLLLMDQSYFCGPGNVS